jgi:hypothetical protein
VGGNRDWQCATGYLGVMCGLCDSENGYAIHQPGNKCTQCAPGEGQHSIYIAVASFFGLLIVVIVTAYGWWPQWLSRVKKVAITGGQHEGRIGKLTCALSKVDELNDAIGSASTMHPPVQPHSAFELFSRAHRLASNRKSIAELQCDWDSITTHAKREYEETAQQEQDHYNRVQAANVRIERSLQAVYSVALAKDDKYGTTPIVYVRGTDLRLHKLNLQEAYQARLTKIKLTVQVYTVCCKFGTKNADNFVCVPFLFSTFKSLCG